MMSRPDGRAPDQLRSVQLSVGFLPYAEGSVLIEQGNTRVICAVSVEEGVPSFLRGQGTGWVTAEYRMLPRATVTRSPRDTSGRTDGRNVEIQRLIGRSLRAAVDRAVLGERTLIVDCDVLTADGGTRTASITGAFVALALACERLRASGQLTAIPIRRQIAAVSAGIVNGTALLDLIYAEDSAADVDCNLVLTDRGETVELQLTAERMLPSSDQVDRVIALAKQGIGELLEIQRAVLAIHVPAVLSALRGA
jgi:ribonuclease PH